MRIPSMHFIIFQHKLKITINIFGLPVCAQASKAGQGAAQEDIIDLPCEKLTNVSFPNLFH